MKLRARCMVEIKRDEANYYIEEGTIVDVSQVNENEFKLDYNGLKLSNNMLQFFKEVEEPIVRAYYRLPEAVMAKYYPDGYYIVTDEDGNNEIKLDKAEFHKRYTRVL